MERKVYLANCGNIDMQQHPDYPLPGTRNYFVEVEDKEDARDKVISYTSDNNLGSGNWIGGHYFEDGIMVGYFSYNGRYWTGDDAIFKHVKKLLSELKTT